MKTIAGQCDSSKEISLSKAAKILSKFVSADNGASHVINAYLHRASAAFNELNQLHKELKSSDSHKKKRKRHRAETNDDNSVRSVETSQELGNGRVKSKNEFGRQRFGGENGDEDDGKSTQAVIKSSQELDGSVGNLAGNVGGSEKHKKNKKKKHEVESRLDGDSRLEFGEREGDGKLPSREQNEIESGQKQGNEGDSNPEMEEGKKQKMEKKKKHKNLEGENAKGQEQQKEIEKKLINGGLVGRQDLEIRTKKKYEAGSGNKLYAEEVKTEQRKKRKNEDLEDRSGDRTEKRMKRKHEGDSDSIHYNHQLLVILTVWSNHQRSRVPEVYVIKDCPLK